MTTSVAFAGFASGINSEVTPAGKPATDQFTGDADDRSALTKNVVDAPAGSVCSVGEIISDDDAAGDGGAGLIVAVAGTAVARRAVGAATIAVLVGGAICCVSAAGRHAMPATTSRISAG